jgi:hypothetical protein
MDLEIWTIGLEKKIEIQLLQWVLQGLNIFIYWFFYYYLKVKFNNQIVKIKNSKTKLKNKEI